MALKDLQDSAEVLSRYTLLKQAAKNVELWTNEFNSILASLSESQIYLDNIAIEEKTVIDKVSIAYTNMLQAISVVKESTDDIPMELPSP